jgi:hypothetical protein
MKYVRVFAGPDGESHFEDVAVELAPVAEYARGIPEVLVSAPHPSTALTFISTPPGWIGEWHCVARRQFMVKLAGETEVIASDGERRQFSPGMVALAEDTRGKGHYSRALGPDDDVWFVAALAEQESS